MGEVWTTKPDFPPLPRTGDEPGVGETLRILDQVSTYYRGAMESLASTEPPAEPGTTDPVTS